MNLRKVLLTLHLVAGLLSALTLLGLGLSGGMLVFEGEIDHWLNRKLFRVEPSGSPMPLRKLAAQAEERHPGHKLAGIVLPSDDSVALILNLRPAAQGPTAGVTVNPYTGQELGSLSTANLFTKKLHQFHTNLLLGPPGKTITVVSAEFLGFLALSGIILWWPRKILKPGKSGAGGRLNFEFHNLLGFYSSIFMLLFAGTGVVIHWDDEVRVFINRWQKIAEDPPIPKSISSPATAPRLDADQLLAVARGAAPGAQATFLLGLGGSGPVRIAMRYPEDRTPAGRTNLYVEPVTGEILWIQTSRTAPIGMRIAKLWNREIHTGDIGGWPTRILASLASFALVLLAITGPLIWIGRLRRRKKNGDPHPRSLSAAG